MTRAEQERLEKLRANAAKARAAKAAKRAAELAEAAPPEPSAEEREDTEEARPPAISDEDIAELAGEDPPPAPVDEDMAPEQAAPEEDGEALIDRTLRPMRLAPRFTPAGEAAARAFIAEQARAANAAMDAWLGSIPDADAPPRVLTAPAPSSTATTSPPTAPPPSTTPPAAPVVAPPQEDDGDPLRWLAYVEGVLQGVVVLLEDGQAQLHSKCYTVPTALSRAAELLRGLL